MSDSSDDGEMRSISTRISQLNQIFMGRAVTSTTHAQAARESLIDALFALYDECNNTQFMRNQYIANFVNKYTKTIKDLRSLRISINDFNIKNTIGRGHFGEVQVVREKHTGDVYALKVLRKADTLAQQNVAFYEEERDIMAKSSSVWITQLQYAFQDARCLYLVMEFHPGGDLLSLLARFDDMFEEKMARFYLSEMVLALHTLHTMGYVHRDVKPENILIDRTGHIKLADFGSACRLAVSTAGEVIFTSVANMPVGTPDYICPEVLMKMNSDDTTGKFGPECDWWSLGVCLYEMLYGKTPFTDENSSMVVTYANIMNHKKCLKFPSNDSISRTATNLMSSLLTDAKQRLDYEKICVHAFFSDVDFDNIRQVRPPFIPTVTSNDDTSNFDDFEKVKRGPDVEDFSKKSTGLTGKDLPFIGFTFTKPLAAQERPSLSTEVASPAARGSLERRLNQKSRELTESRERYKELEHKLAGSTSELNRLRNQMMDRDGRIEKLEAERRTLELDKAHYMTEVKSLTRLLEMEKQDREQTEDKAMNLLADIRKQTDVAQQLRDQETKQELEEHKEVISQLEDENRQLSEQISRLEHNLQEETAGHYDAMAKIDVFKAKIVELKQKDQNKSEQESLLQKELKKAHEQRYEAMELCATMRQSKTRLEEELYALRRRSNMEDMLRSHIDAEDTRQSLEMHKNRLEIVEKREASLREQLVEKSQHVTQLAQRVADLEEENESARMEHSTHEKLWQQREEQLRRQIKELESMADSIRGERSMLEEQSIIISEDCEEKLRKIYEQEETILQLKNNVEKLEVQLEDLRDDLESAQENHKLRHSEEETKRKVRSRRSGFSQTDTPPWKTLRHEGQRTGQTQTDTPSPTKRSIQIQYEQSSPERRSNGIQVNLNTSNITPRKRSNQMQTDDSSPNVTCRRKSNNTQTDTPGRRSNNMQTEVTVHVSMSAGPDSPIPEEADISDYVDSRDNITAGSASSEDSANTTVIHCGQGDTPKSKKARKSEEEPKRKLSEKEANRRGTEEWSDLQQQCAYLEMRVSNLEEQVNEYKESAHQQRLRALDLKIEMRDKTTGLETQVSELKEKLDAAELALSAAKEEASNCTQKEGTLREKLEKVQRDLDDVRIEGRRKVTDLTIERDDLQAKVKALNSKVATLEPKENELREYQIKCQQLEPKNKDLAEYAARLEARLLLVTDASRYEDLERRVEELQEDKTRLRLDTEKYRDELQQSKHEHDKLKVQHNELKNVAEELEKQLQDFEQLSEQYEKKASKWTNHKSTYEKAVSERENELEETHRNLNKEKSFRQRDEVKVKQLTEEVASLRETSQKKIDALTAKLQEAKATIKDLATQMTELERTNSHFEIDLSTSRRHLEASNEDNLRLKEEISNLITTVGEVKASNLKLSKSLEEAMDRYEMLASQNTDLQNQAESNMVNANHEKYKLESTLNQQVKLIDYLQAKVENPPKKKKGLFGGKKSDSAPTGIQFRELQHSLEHERNKNSMLRETITRLQTELYQYKATGSKSYDQTDLKRSSEALTLTPSSRTEQMTSSYSIPKVNAGGSRPRKERMHHNIPHRFVTGLNSRATKCAVCLGSVHFVKQAAKCQECQTVCHPKCAPNLPASCGLPTEYVSHFSDVMARQSSSRISVADLRLKLNTWMKIPRPGKQLWEKKWVSLSDNHIHIYSTQDTSEDHVEEFALCPSNGTVTIHSAVTAAELTNTASTDLPYILRLEFEPETTCWPGRSLYLMALSFDEKQRWVATLEAIVDHGQSDHAPEEAKLLGNTILSLSGDQRMEFNCTLPINDRAVLVGTDDGLFVADITSGTTSQPLRKVNGVTAVYQMEVISSLDVVVMITGRDRQVVLIGLGEMQQAAVGGSRPGVTPYALTEAAACTTLASGVTATGTFLCTALADKILLMVYDDEEETFVLAKELLTSQACSCIYFGQNHVIVGTDKFHKIDLQSYQMSDLLDKRDTTLAFAAFGAAHYNSFPIAVLQVAPPGEPDEYLLCFHEFGVFVNKHGSRSRDDDMKWSGLPLAFAYRAPYLYIIHFNAVQVTEIPPSHQHHSEGAKTMLRLPAPRYLGPALSTGAVYIGSAHDNTTDIICFKGNMVTATAVSSKENTRPLSQQNTPLTHQKTSKRQLVDSNFVSPDEASPPNIRKLDRSPVGSLSRRKVARVATPAYTSSTSSDAENEDMTPAVRVGVQIRARAEQRRQQQSYHDSSDTSF